MGRAWTCEGRSIVSRISIYRVLAYTGAALLGCGGTSIGVEEGGGDAGPIDGGPTGLCATDQTACGGACVDLSNDALNCGTCETDCTKLAGSAGASCLDGKCVITACSRSEGDCDHIASNGCESDLTSVKTCGSCDLSCDADTFVCGNAAGSFACVPPESPRLIAPMSTSSSTTRRPTFRWAVSASVSYSTLDICEDRECVTRIAPGIKVTGGSYTPLEDLPEGNVFWRVHALSSADEISKTWQLKIGPRSAANSEAFGSVLDLNGDGISDFVLREANYNSENVFAFYYAGNRAASWTDPTVTMFLPSPDDFTVHSLNGTVGSAGDVNGDGYGDLAIGVPYADGQIGEVRIYFGGPAGPSAVSDQVISSPYTDTDFGGTTFGSAVAAAGDVNGDGYGDIIVGIQRGRSIDTFSYLFFGSATGVSQGSSLALDNPGATSFPGGGPVVGALDVNGDGYADVAEADAPVAIYAGSASPAGNMPTASRSFPFVRSIAGGDFNGDGFSDLAVGEVPGQAFVSGAAVVSYSSGSAGIDFSRNTVVTNSKTSALTIDSGDVNDDGYTDLIVQRMDDNSNTVEHGTDLYLGGAEGLSTTSTVLPDGYSAVLADVNGDGYSDLLLGDWSNVQGHVTVFLGGVDGIAASASAVVGPSGSYTHGIVGAE